MLLFDVIMLPRYNIIASSAQYYLLTSSLLCRERHTWAEIECVGVSIVHDGWMHW